MTNQQRKTRKKQGVAQALENQKVHFQRGEIAGRKAEVAMDGQSMDLYQGWCGGLGVHACFIALSGRRPRGSTDDYQVCVIVVTIRR